MHVLLTLIAILNPNPSKILVQFIFQKPLAIPWNKIVFGVDNSDIHLYVHMNDVYKII